jgi:ubiquitin C-terminal hydrolase
MDPTPIPVSIKIPRSLSAPCLSTLAPPDLQKTPNPIPSVKKPAYPVKTAHWLGRKVTPSANEYVKTVNQVALRSVYVILRSTEFVISSILLESIKGVCTTTKDILVILFDLDEKGENGQKKPELATGKPTPTPSLAWDSKSTTVVRSGFGNSGMNCYMASLMQCLSANPAFHTFIAPERTFKPIEENIQLIRKESAQAWEIRKRCIEELANVLTHLKEDKAIHAELERLVKMIREYYQQRYVDRNKLHEVYCAGAQIPFHPLPVEEVLPLNGPCTIETVSRIFNELLELPKPLELNQDKLRLNEIPAGNNQPLLAALHYLRHPDLQAFTAKQREIKALENGSIISGKIVESDVAFKIRLQFVEQLRHLMTLSQKGESIPGSELDKFITYINDYYKQKIIDNNQRYERYAKLENSSHKPNTVKDRLPLGIQHDIEEALTSVCEMLELPTFEKFTESNYRFPNGTPPDYPTKETKISPFVFWQVDLPHKAPSLEPIGNAGNSTDTKTDFDLILSDIMLNDREKRETFESAFGTHLRAPEIPKDTVSVKQFKLHVSLANGEEVVNKIPRFLPIILKRFSNTESGYGYKIYSPTHFDPLLDIPIEGHRKKARYRLTSVGIHGGGCSGGHYTAWGVQKIEGKDRWVFFNDSSSSLSSESEHEKVAEWCKNGYLSCYEFVDLVD